MATNKYPWSKNIFDPSKPLIMPGQVQAGSTQAIKAGEICTFDETSGVFVPLDAVADRQYSLAIAAQEQKATDLARYIDFIMPREGDVFEFTASAAAQVALGDALIPVASQSQQLTRDVDGNFIAVSVGVDNYPQTGTTLRSMSYFQAMIHPSFSYLYQNVLQRNVLCRVNLTADYTIKVGDCGKVFTNSGASGGVTITGPTNIVPVGFYFDMVCETADGFVFDPKPDEAAVIIAGGAQTAGNYASITDEGDFIRWMWDGTNWVAVFSISGADGDITIES
jgi:hypothetical protein